MSVTTATPSSGTTSSDAFAKLIEPSYFVEASRTGVRRSDHADRIRLQLAALKWHGREIRVPVQVQG